jgi:hypothetical protein
MRHLIYDKIISWAKGTGNKKYKVIIENSKTGKKRTLQFGSALYEQYRDSSPLRLYSKKNHGDKKRRELYFLRHSGKKNKKEAIAKELKLSKNTYTPKILSHIYLW